jgi:hypothetical protein
MAAVALTVFVKWLKILHMKKIDKSNSAGSCIFNSSTCFYNGIIPRWKNRYWLRKPISSTSIAGRLRNNLERNCLDKIQNLCCWISIELLVNLMKIIYKILIIITLCSKKEKLRGETSRFPKPKMYCRLLCLLTRAGVDRSIIIMIIFPLLVRTSSS